MWKKSEPDRNLIHERTPIELHNSPDYTPQQYVDAYTKVAEAFKSVDEPPPPSPSDF